MKIIKVGSAELKVKVAKTAKDQARGLMEISKLADDEGMLFEYPSERELSFWMKKTTIPLSIAFINKEKKIIEIRDMEPLDEEQVKSSAPVQWALEVNQGWFDQNNIKIGQEIDFCPKKTIKIKIIKLPREALKLAKTIEDVLSNMVTKVIQTKVGVDNDLENFHVDVEE